jgi:hypothetical protein
MSCVWLFPQKGQSVERFLFNRARSAQLMKWRDAVSILSATNGTSTSSSVSETTLIPPSFNATKHGYVHVPSDDDIIKWMKESVADFFDRHPSLFDADNFNF